MSELICRRIEFWNLRYMGTEPWSRTSRLVSQSFHAFFNSYTIPFSTPTSVTPLSIVIHAWPIVFAGYFEIRNCLRCRVACFFIRPPLPRESLPFAPASTIARQPLLRAQRSSPDGFIQRRRVIERLYRPLLSTGRRGRRERRRRERKQSLLSPLVTDNFTCPTDEYRAFSVLVCHFRVRLNNVLLNNGTVTFSYRAREARE